MADRRVVKEGMVAGLLGAAGVAAWFLVVDLVAGEPFRTPVALGQATFSVLGKGIDWSPAAYVAGYTVLHVGVFMLIGLVISLIVEASKRTPGVLAGLLILFAVFEVGFYFFTLFLAQPETVGRIAWYQIGAANLVAAGVMGWYLWREHPELKGRFSRALVGESS
jgi:hypothetical protein